ncbi:MAG: hypothetical protein US69_C0001G0052 [candidate division TM6 bacterium GW2011_GWF2_38_10]|nr:MAG: hypothetical protein US69_C0001G0052 [candidate division TM6 bacterium GW2011_GWF2_38_10]
MMRLFILRTYAHLLFIFMIASQSLLAVNKGSESVLSIEPFFTFPAEDSDNRMLAFGWFKNGFALEDQTTTCTFESVFPINGRMDLNGGSLFLQTNLFLHNQGFLDTPGTIYGNEFAFHLAETATTIACPTDIILEDISLYLNSDITLSGTMRFKGSSVIDGQWHKINFGDDAYIIVDSGAQLRLHNVEIGGVAQERFQCADDDASIILDNVDVGLSDDYVWSHGSILFLKRNSIGGAHDFSYESPMTSTIAASATLKLKDDIELTIGRYGGVDSPEPLYFADRSSTLNLHNCSLNVTSSGIMLYQGKIKIEGKVIFDVASTTSTCGMILGTGDVPAEDLELRLEPGATVHLIKGHVVSNILGKNMMFPSCIGRRAIKKEPEAYFHLNKDVSFTDIDFLLEYNQTVVIPDDAVIIHNNSLFQSDSYDFYLTATRQNYVSSLFDGEGHLLINRGIFPGYLMVQKNNNIIQGVGEFLGQILLNGPDAELSFQLNGALLDTLTLNNGSIIILERNLALGKGVTINGVGLVDLKCNDLTIASGDTAWTSTLYFDGMGGSVNLRKNCTLTSRWTFSGDCVLSGRNNTIYLSQTGCIEVERGSTLELKNIKIEHINDHNLYCKDLLGTLEWRGAMLDLDESVTFSCGGIYVPSTSTIVTHEYTWTFDTCASCTIDNATLYYDTTTDPNTWNLQPDPYGVINNVNKFITLKNHGFIAHKQTNLRPPSNNISQNKSFDSDHPLIIDHDRTINGNGYSFRFTQDPNLIMLHNGASLTFENVQLKGLLPEHIYYDEGGSVIFGENITIELARVGKGLEHIPLTLNRTCSFNGGGYSIIDGGYRRLILDEHGGFDLLDSSTLLIKNTFIAGISGNKIKSLGRHGTVIFRNCTLELDADYSYTHGFMIFTLDNTILGRDNRFIYSSPNSCTICADSSIILDYNVTFSYDPITHDPNLLYFRNHASTLCLQGGVLHATKGGLNLVNGTLIIDKSSTFSSEIDYVLQAETQETTGITLGNGTQEGDMTCIVYPMARLCVGSGHFTYNNVNQSLFSMGNGSVFRVQHNACLELLQNFSVGCGRLILDNTGYIQKDASIALEGEVSCLYN